MKEEDDYERMTYGDDENYQDAKDFEIKKWSL